MSQRLVIGHGGPVIALPSQLVPDWGGILRIKAGSEEEAGESFSPSGEPTDYDRACTVSEWVMLIDVGDSAALVLDLNDEPGPAITWVPRERGGLIVGGGEPENDEFLKLLEAGEWKPVKGRLAIPSGVLVMSSAATPGEEIPEQVESLSVSVPPGDYELAVQETDPDGDRWTVAVRLSVKRDSGS